jgi:transcriptional regulator with GAF, ATPase, and Fis domain
MSTAAPPSATKILSVRDDDVERVRVYALRISSPGTEERRVDVRQPILRVGAHEGNDVVIPDEAVSRIHFEISADARGFRLRDLGSTNGTFVDGMRVVEVHLRPSCRITVGLSSIHFEILDAEAELLLSSADHFGPLIGKSRPMRELFAKLEKVAPSEATVLVQGESGTGKELIAEAIHGASSRRGGPLVVFDCSAIAANLLESELFGHEKGAFTDAHSQRIGCLEEADGGTLFLDEIGELPLELQPKLLRAVEKREIRRVGASKARQVDVRIVAATNRDLSSEVNRGSFRADLYYRLAVVRLEIPPLRDRPDDIPILVEHMLTRLLKNDSARVLATLEAIAPETWTKLAQLPWRGNVRELRNFIERRLALGDRDDSSDLHVLEPTEPSSRASATSAPEPKPSALRIEYQADPERPMFEQREELVARFERAYLNAVLAQQNGNISRAAAIARIDRMYFKRLLKKHQ